MTDKNGNTVHTMKGATSNYTYEQDFGPNGSVFNGLNVTLTDNSDVLYIHVK
jgi:hypothetical protein